MPVLARCFRTSSLTALTCLLGVTTAVAGPEEKPAARDRAAPTSLALPARQLVWPSLPRLSLWWHGAQPAASNQPAQPAPTTPAEPAPAPAAEPAQSAPPAEQR